MEQTKRINIKEVNRNKFFQMPQWLFTEERYMKLSNDCKVAYMLLKDRHELSKKSAEEKGTFIDEKGDIYFVYTIMDLMNILHKSDKTVTKIKNELIKVGLIEEERLGQGYANRYYLTEPTFNEIVKNDKKEAETIDTVENRKNYDSKQTLDNKGIVNSPILESEKLRCNNTYINNTNKKIKDIVNKEKNSVTNSENNSVSINNLETTKTEKQNLSLKEKLIDTCNSFHTKFTVGRWNKKQWNKVVNTFVEETIRENRKIDNLPAYVYKALSQIAYNHDVKNGKIVYEPTEYEIKKEIPTHSWID